MTFTVTYRGADGAMRAERIEAAGRGECFAQCRARGIAPISVKDGVLVSRRGAEARRGEDGGSPRRDASDNRGRKGTGQQARKRMVASVLCVALVALIAGGVWWWMGRDKARPSPEPELPKKAALPKEVKPTAAPKPLAEAKKPAATNIVTESPAPAPWRNPELTEDKRLEVYEKALAESPLPNTSSNRLFRSGIEQVMGWMFTTEVGDRPPPLPRIPDFDLVHLQEILDSKCEIGASDSERQAETKGIVDFAKAELKKYLEKGGNPDEFLKYYHDQLKTAHQHRQIVQDQVMKVLQEEPERAEDFLKDANKGLAELGIKAVVIPERIKQRLGLISQKE